MTSLAVIVPMYNEEDGAEESVVALAAVLETIPGSHLIAVDDGSSDATPAILDRLGDDIPLLRVVHRKENGGYGAALRAGVEKAQMLGTDWALFVDSDLTNPPEDVPRFAALMDEPVDYIKASRFIGGGGMVGVPARRRLLSVTANRFARLATGRTVTDPTNGFRAVRTSAFLAMPLTERGFPIIMEELYWAFRHRLRFGEVPSTLGSREETGDSSFSYRPRVLAAYASYVVRIAGTRWLGRSRTAPAGGTATREHLGPNDAH
jgi:dolichol-phosphate mannosyltransferase